MRGQLRHILMCVFVSTLDSRNRQQQLQREDVVIYFRGRLMWRIIVIEA